jgi:hypothetical protein
MVGFAVFRSNRTTTKQKEKKMDPPPETYQLDIPMLLELPGTNLPSQSRDIRQDSTAMKDEQDLVHAVEDIQLGETL